MNDFSKKFTSFLSFMQENAKFKSHYTLKDDTVSSEVTLSKKVDPLEIKIFYLFENDKE